MKRSINQAVYNFLPHMWVSIHDESQTPVSAEILNWNYTPMAGIYESFIEGEIKRQIKLFGEREGDISSFDISLDNNSFLIVEPARRENVPDIIAEISPLVFYCSACGDTFELHSYKDVDKQTWKCKKCGKTVKQLQMVYSCECGYAQPIKIPHISGVKNYKYRPNEAQYKMIYRNGQSEKYAEFVQTCPVCKSRLVPDNSNSQRNYKPFSLKIIRTVNNFVDKFSA